MTITRQMLGKAHDVLLKRGLMLSGELIEEMYDAMEFQRQKEDYSDGDTQDVLLAKITTLKATLRQAREALEEASDNYYAWGMHDGNTSVDQTLAAIDAALSGAPGKELSDERILEIRNEIFARAVLKEAGK